jgi:TPR repeat protein
MRTAEVLAQVGSRLLSTFWTVAIFPLFLALLVKSALAVPPQNPSTKHECKQIDERADIALSACSWKGGDRWQVTVEMLNNSDIGKSFDIRCNPDITPEVVVDQFRAFRIDDAEHSVVQMHFTLEDVTDRPKLQCKISRVGDNYADELPGDKVFGNGVAAYQQGDYETALRVWRPLAEEGYANAQHNLGLMFENGEGIQEDFAEAAKWYRLAAEQDDAYAQLNLGKLYDNAKGVPLNHVEAVKWYRFAALQDYAPAQRNLGYAYHAGQGVAQDYAEAMKWYRKAADQGDAYAQNALGDMFFTGRGIKQDYVEAIRWFRRAAEQGFIAAQGNLGFVHSEGRGVPRDHTEAAKWIRLAAEQGDAESQYNLAKFYHAGEGVPHDLAEDEKWILMSV